MKPYTKKIVMLTLRINPKELKFLNNSDWKCRTFFQVWQTLIQNVYMGNFRYDATTVLDMVELQLIQYGLSEDDILASYTFYNVFPKEVSDIPLSMGNSELEMFSVTFAYSHWG